MKAEIDNNIDQREIVVKKKILHAPPTLVDKRIIHK